MEGPHAVEAPGVALVVLRRRPTSTDVLFVRSPTGEAEIPMATPTGDQTQWNLAEDLLRRTGIEETTRLYASALTVHRDGAALGVFVAFAGREPATSKLEDPKESGALEGSGDPNDPGVPGDWVDLREACDGLAPTFTEILCGVRERFIAVPPDEALRIR